MTIARNTLHFALAGFAALLCCPYSAHADVTMKVALHVHHIPATMPGSGAGPKSALPADTDVAQEVTLAGDHIEVKADGGETIYDFKTRKRYVIDLNTKTYVEYSLYDAVGFRSMEYANRLAMQQMLAAAKVDTPKLFDKASNEQMLSIEDKDPSTLEFKESGKYMIVSSGANELARWSVDGTKLDPVDISRFVQFVRYTGRGHPQVLARLAGQDSIPAHLALTTQATPVGDVYTLDVSAIKTVVASAYDLHAYARRQTAQQDTGFADLLDRAQRLSPEDVKRKAGEIAVERDKDIQESRFVQALLGTLEWNLMTGTIPAPFTGEQTAKMNQDPEVKKFLTALVPHSKEEAKADADTLAALRAQLPQKTAVLAVFEANERGQAGDFRGAAALYRTAIQANPELSGAYKDLGDFLYSQYRTDDAWRSWDAGRKMAPQFPNFKPISDLEARLASQYPAYFK